jgi:hypothetical protein
MGSPQPRATPLWPHAVGALAPLAPGRRRVTDQSLRTVFSRYLVVTQSGEQLQYATGKRGNPAPDEAQ